MGRLMPAYTPFDKELAELQPQDLSALKSALEGWYIEYKREVPGASAMAKSISSFANTYGGWLFYGVVEESKENPVAGTFPGIARDKVDPALQAMRQAVAGQLSGTPYFETRVLWGPCDSIGLASEYAVIWDESTLGRSFVA